MRKTNSKKLHRGQKHQNEKISRDTLKWSILEKKRKTRVMAYAAKADTILKKGIKRRMTKLKIQSYICKRK